MVVSRSWLRVWGALGYLAALGCLGALLAACPSEEQVGGGSAAGTTSAGGTGGGASSTTPSTSSGEEPQPIECDAEYSNVPAAACDLLQQDCLPGETCVPRAVAGAWTTRCVGGRGLKDIGRICSVDDECMAGLFCIADRCSPVCCPANDEPCGGGACTIEVDYGGALVRMCSFADRCDVLTEEACPPGTECHLTDPVQGLATCSFPSSDQVEEGEVCVYANDCKDMQHCASFKGDPVAICRYYCFVSSWSAQPLGLGGCPVDQTCNPIDFGVPDVGLCLPEE